MRLTIFLLTAAFVHAHATSSAQNISLSGKNLTLEQVFSAIEKQTGYVVLGNEELFASRKTVSLSVSDIPLRDLLDMVLKDQPFKYTIADKTIFISRKPAAPSQDAPSDGPPVNIASLQPVSGSIVDSSGSPVQGASIRLTPGDNGTSSNADGSFVIANVEPGMYTLEISFVGFETVRRKITVKESEPVTIGAVRLNRSANKLDEIQVIAYGTVSKRLNTGSVSTVKTADIEKQPVSNPLLALQGRMPGVVIKQETGAVGGGVAINIRGKNSIANGNDPLYIVDGMQYPAANVITGGGGPTSGAISPFHYLNPGDIESIDVLKDADATAIYGSRGANGVILITTKKGKAGRMKVDVNVYQGTGKVSRKLDLLNTEQYLQMRREAFKNDNATPNPAFDYDLTVWDTTRYTDWQKELIGNTAHYTDVQTAISGGANNIQYLFRPAYHRETSVYPGSFADQKFSGLFTISATSLNRKFKVDFSGNYSLNDQNMPFVDLAQFVLTTPPDAPSVYKPDGSFNWENGTFNNPLAAYTLSKFKSVTNNFIANATLSYELLKGLILKTSFGFTSMQTGNVSTSPIASYNPYRDQVTGSAGFDNSTIRYWMVEPQITYNKRIAKGDLEVLVGSTLQQNKTNETLLYASGYTNDALLENLGSAVSVNSFSQNFLYKYNALFGRINYNWENKYIVNLTGRRDGSSRFGPGKRFANFGAAGIAWIFSEEKFLKNPSSGLSFGKLRASYGITGNDQISDFRYIALYQASTSPYQGIKGLYPQNLENPDYAWEVNKKMELGLDLGFFNDRLLLNVSYYCNRSSNQLIGYSLPAITGFANIVANFPAVVQNSGFEFSINTVNVKKTRFRWSSSFNISLPRNKLAEFPGFEQSGYNYNYIIGKSISIQRLYHLAGVDPVSGRFQFSDAGGKPVFDPNSSTDRIASINIDPRFFGGLQNTFNIGSFQLDFFFQFHKQTRQKFLYNLMPGYWQTNQPVTVLDRWQKEGDIATYQRYNQDFSYYSGIDYANQSDFAYGDASFIRLKNVSLSYQLPGTFVNRMHIDGIRVYLQGQNLMTITKYQGWDPETLTYLPPIRVITAGVQFNL